MTGPFAALPPFDQTALFVDLDGTLLDIAPTPEQVIVPEGLPDALRALRHRLGDALAVVSGRPVEQLEALLGDAPFALAGEHGGAVRFRPAAQLERFALPAPVPAWYEVAERIAEKHDGVRLERKAHGFVLHYRARPALGEQLGEEIGALIAGSEAFLLMPARKAWEVRPRGVDKGTAVRTLMRNPPFAGKRPLFIGDDVTDEDGIRAAEALGGCGLRVPEVFGGPTEVRHWLARAASHATWPAEVGKSA
ncbi:MAG: trehalose-phosphatase [Acetobacteraceae bacterium]|nr:trehalose-phosphatase [Acetobacteraceae bacterium]